jgi:tetratricopeptide (TPR) repeat protein
VNSNLLNVVKLLIDSYGEEVLGEPGRLKTFFSNLAKEEPKSLHIAFRRCIEAGAYSAFKSAQNAAERVSCKATIAQRVHGKYRLDAALCHEALDILETALYRTVSAAPQATPVPPNSPPPKKKHTLRNGLIVAALVIGVTVLVVNYSSLRTVGYFKSGNAYNNKGDYDRAIADYTEALRLDPNLVAAYFNRGDAYRNKGDYDRAIADYTEALRLDPNLASNLNPNFAFAYNNRGIAYYEKGNYDRAIADYTEALRLNPNYTEAYNNRGIAYYEKGNYDRAIADFTEALRIKPNFAFAYSNRGYAYYKKGDFGRALTDFNEALRVDPNYASAYNHRGLAY